MYTDQIAMNLIVLAGNARSKAMEAIERSASHTDRFALGLRQRRTNHDGHFVGTRPGSLNDGIDLNRFCGRIYSTSRRNEAFVSRQVLNFTETRIHMKGVRQ